MIGCDEVFMVLTRGPFPTGRATDLLVENHLEHCTSCRRLAEALRPAEELVPEAVTPEESRTLPSYWGPQGAIEPRVLSAVLAEFEYEGHERPARRWPLRLECYPQRTTTSISWSQLLPFLGAVCLGAALALAGSVLIAPPLERPASTSAAP